MRMMRNISAVLTAIALLIGVLFYPVYASGSSDPCGPTKWVQVADGGVYGYWARGWGLGKEGQTPKPLTVTLSGRDVHGWLLRTFWVDEGDNDLMARTVVTPVSAGTYTLGTEGEWFSLVIAAVSDGVVTTEGKTYTIEGRHSLHVDWPDFEVRYSKSGPAPWVAASGGMSLTLTGHEGCEWDRPADTAPDAKPVKVVGWEDVYKLSIAGQGEGKLYSKAREMSWTFPFCCGSAKSWLSQEIEKAKKREQIKPIPPVPSKERGSNLIMLAAALGAVALLVSLLILLAIRRRRRVSEEEKEE